MNAIKHMLAGILAICAVACAAAPAANAVPVGPPTWSDEFGGDTLDAEKWAHRLPETERQDGLLARDAVSVNDGILTIKTYTKDAKHYSGMISTHPRGPRALSRSTATSRRGCGFTARPASGRRSGCSRRRSATRVASLSRRASRWTSSSTGRAAGGWARVQSRRRHLRPRAARPDLGRIRPRPPIDDPPERRPDRAGRRRLAHLGDELDPHRGDVPLRRHPGLVRRRADLAPQPVPHPELGGRAALRRRDPERRVRLAREHRHGRGGRLRARLGHRPRRHGTGERERARRLRLAAPRQHARLPARRVVGRSRARAGYQWLLDGAHIDGASTPPTSSQHATAAMP